MNIVSTAFDILRVMCRHQIRSTGDDPDDYEYVYCGFRWSAHMIRLFTADEPVDKSLRWLLSRSYVYIDKGQYWISSAGVAANRAAAANPHLNRNDVEFRDEILTGTTQSGKPSPRKYDSRRVDGHGLQIDRSEKSPALPSKPVYYSTPREVTYYLRDSRAAHELAAELGMELCELLDMIRLGEDCPIRPCSGVDGHSPHFGKFHHHNGSRGQRWQYKCIECRKELRRMRRNG